MKEKQIHTEKEILFTYCSECSAPILRGETYSTNEYHEPVCLGCVEVEVIDTCHRCGAEVTEDENHYFTDSGLLFCEFCSEKARPIYEHD